MKLNTNGRNQQCKTIHDGEVDWMRAEKILKYFQFKFSKRWNTSDLKLLAQIQDIVLF